MANGKPTPQDYDVGYGKPPRSTQFKPGLSGNPKGRPKGRSSFQSLLEKQLYKPTKIRVGETVKNVSLLEIGVMKLAQALVQSDAKQMITILKFLLPNLTPDQGCPQCDYIKQLTDEELDQQLSQHLINDFHSFSKEQREILLAQMTIDHD